ncbi:DNA helicase [Tanacetum coccineum]
MHHFGGDNSGFHRDIVKGLIELLDNYNALYELPTGDMLGAIVYEPGPETEKDYGITIEQLVGQPQRVNKLHPSYMSLQFPLLFVYGEDGYSKEMKLVRPPGTSFDEHRRLTMKAYYSYMLHDHNLIDFTREHQNDIRNEYLFGIYDVIMRGDNDGSDCGGRLILPQSFTGGPRYMYAHYLDALAICRVHGNPSYFITYTCNIKWLDIAEYMEDFPGLTNFNEHISSYSNRVLE